MKTLKVRLFTGQIKDTKMIQNRNFVEIVTPQNSIGIDIHNTVMRLKCNRCHGEGKLRELIYPYRPDEQYDIKECPNCEGSGWLDAIITVKFEPVKYEIRQSKIDVKHFTDDINKIDKAHRAM